MATRKTKLKPHYHNILPAWLHEEADGLVDYFTYFPFIRPKACCYCEGKSFHVASTSKDGIEFYRCNTCERGFNQLTGTPFARMSHPDKWGDFVSWRLCGLSLLRVSQKIGISHNACKMRDKKFLIIMQKRTPELYEWWINHQNRNDMSMSSLVFEQKKQFKAWLQQIINQKERPCPKCHKKCGRLINVVINTERPQFYCEACRSSFNPLVGTPFHKMHFIELWLPYFEMLTDGFSHRRIEKEMGISRRSLVYWKKNFLKQMDVMRLHALSQWIHWQKSRSQFKTSQNRKT